MEQPGGVGVSPDQIRQLLQARQIEQVRFGWCDVHGAVRGKTLTREAALRALDEGVGMVSTLLLKDSSDRTAYKVFEAGGVDDLPGFGQANNLILRPLLDSYRELPWVDSTAWLQCQPWFQDGSAVELDSRRVLQRAIDALAARGWAMRCGLEVEFHIYRIVDTQVQLDPAQAAWPGDAPQVQMIHPGYNLLTEAWYDMAEPALRSVQRTVQSLGLPLSSLEVELGPSQVEAVFEPTDALQAADNMVLLRNAVRQALRRAGYHASFVCRPPFPNIMSSGWHLHQSLVDARSGANLFMREHAAPQSDSLDAEHVLSGLGAAYLAGLLTHAQGMTALCTPTANGYGRFRPNALAPLAALWGRDNRGAMLRVVGAAGQASTRIENRLGEPAANPYLYMASQIWAGLDGVDRGLRPPPATQSPYAPSDAPALPTDLDAALDALCGDACLSSGLGVPFVRYFERLKRAEALRRSQAEDVADFDRREYFARL